MRKILITGAAGFIGFHLTKLLLKETNYEVVALDSLNDYYDVKLKKDRLNELKVTFHDNAWQSSNPKLHFIHSDMSDKGKLGDLFEEYKFDFVVHLAAQAGVRYYLENPDSYVQSNLIEFVNLCECVKNASLKHFVFASSSSVYGVVNEVPFIETADTSKPVSLYGATKKANEVIAHSYAHLYKTTTSALRFFTVYGEWGRPDMAYFSFTKNIIEEKPIQIFNNGKLSRDFTYVEDIVKSIKLLLEKRVESNGPNIFEEYNIGNSTPIELMDFITILEKQLGIDPIKIFKEMQDGDVYHTYADTQKLSDLIGFAPEVNLETGIQKFVDWYKDYYSK